jgi:hypothetical protein
MTIEDSAIDSMLPKFDDVPMRTYFMMLAYVRRPSCTPSASTPRSESSSTISAAARAMSVASSTDTPTSAVRMAGASLIPSPMKPTVWPPA